jgi:hypothetical protein
MATLDALAASRWVAADIAEVGGTLEGERCGCRCGHEVLEQENSFDCAQMMLNVCHLQEKPDLPRVSLTGRAYAAHAFTKLGLFGLQHTVCQPRVAKWRQTVERLKSVFKGWGG